MKLALTVWNPLWEEKEENKRQAEKLISKASESDAEFVLFPEMTLTGFSMHVEKIADKKDCSETLNFFKRLSLKYSIAIGFGYVTRNVNGKGENRFAIISEGKVLGDYCKIHPFSYAGEDEVYDAGNNLCHVKLHDIVFGMYICYDLRFPEVFLSAAKKCNAMIVIANWPDSRKGQWEALLRSRAIETQCYLVGVNRTGEGNGILYPLDSSKIFNPLGEEVLLQKEEGLFLGEIDVGMVLNYRKEFPVLNDRRVELYQTIASLKQEDNHIGD